MRLAGLRRSLVLGPAVVLSLGVGVAAGAAGQALIVGASNDGGSSQTILKSSSTGASFTLKNTETAATGVFGWSSAASGSGRGVYGRADGSSGKGVHGVATATAGTSIGVHGTSASPGGHGVLGQGPGIAVVGETAGAAGVGVMGDATSPTGTTSGVVGRSSSPQGTAVLGLSTAASDGIGVSGSAVSDDGIGVHGTVTGAHADASAVFGWNTGTMGQGALGFGPTGVYGVATSTDGAGVRAEAAASGGTALLLSNGGVTSSNGPGFVADPSAAEICENGESFAIDSPYANGRSDALVLVTPRTTAAAFRVVYAANAAGACNEALSGGRWIVETPGSAVTTATEFNVWVVNR